MIRIADGRGDMYRVFIRTEFPTARELIEAKQWFANEVDERVVSFLEFSVDLFVHTSLHTLFGSLRGDSLRLRSLFSYSLAGNPDDGIWSREQPC